MNARLVTGEAADRDIRDIVTYIAADSPQAAERFRVEIWDAFRLITEQPDIGRAHSEFAVPLRSIRVSSRFRKYLAFLSSYWPGNCGSRPRLAWREGYRQPV